MEDRKEEFKKYLVSIFTQFRQEEIGNRLSQFAIIFLEQSIEQEFEKIFKVEEKSEK